MGVYDEPIEGWNGQIQSLVSDAYEDLEGEGYILTRQGLGTVVAELSEEKISARLRGPVHEAFGEAVRAGQRAGFDGEELHRILEETMRAEETRADRADTRRSKP